MNVESMLLNDPAPATDLLEVDPPPALSRCLDHGVAGCSDCLERIKRAREVAAARLKRNIADGVHATAVRPGAAGNSARPGIR